MLDDGNTSRELTSGKVQVEGNASANQWMIGLAPYVFIIGASTVLYHYANKISYTPISGQMGPEEWPKLIIGLLMAICAFEIARRLLAAVKSRGFARAVHPDADEGFSQQMEAHPLLVLAAAVVTVVYLLLFDVLGFFTGTILYVACVMWIGGVRRPLLVAVLSLVMTFGFSLFFLKLIYVALPLGMGPFEQISLFIIKLIGV